MVTVKSRNSTAKHLSCDELLHYRFIIQGACKFFLISEHLVKLQTKRLIMSYAPFALDFCPQRCRTLQISKITCIWQTETAADRCVNRQVDVSLLSTNIKTSFDLLTDRLTPSVTDQLLIMCGILLQHLFLCYSSCVQSILGFFIWLVWTLFC